MPLNSKMLIPNGMTVAIKAKLLGHSIQTNLALYSFAEKFFRKSIYYFERQNKGTSYQVNNPPELL